MTATSLEPRAAPIPQGRGRWRIVAYRRPFADVAPVPIAELVNARGRQLVQAWDTPAELTFTLDGNVPNAALIVELATEVIAYRWSESLGRDVAMFRGYIDHSEDQLTEQSATVTFTAHDYLSHLTRRLLTSTLAVVQMDQDSIVYQLVTRATTTCQSSSGTSFMPGSFLPLTVARVNPDGSTRPLSGVLRDRTYGAQTDVGDALDALAHVIQGFDYDVLPMSAGNLDQLRIWFPYQGVTRTDLVLAYGANVLSLTRTVSSSDYANYCRVLGNNSSADAATPQVFAESWNSDANNVTVNPVGLFMEGQNAADVTIATTLSDQAAGYVNTDGILVPSYTVNLRPGAYHYGSPNMGDIVPLVIQAGRLDVSTSIRVLGITYDIGDDGQEDVALVLGRTRKTLAKLFTQADRDVDALVRR